MKDAKNYIRGRWAADLSNGISNRSALENVLNDPRIKIELLPPPPRFELCRAAFSSSWNVVDTKTTFVIATFFDQARAIVYAKWQNSLEE